MKITGTILTQKTMAEMSVGETGFLDWNAITLINKKQVLINPNYDTATYNIKDCIVPVKRIGEGKEDYEINVYINKVFYNSILSEKEVEDLKVEDKLIGPYDVGIEIQDDNNQDQLYQRMTWNELIECFIEWNKPLVEGTLSEGEQQLFMDNKTIIISHMGRYIDNMKLETLEHFKNTFKPINDPKNPDLYNPYEDKELDMLIVKRIKSIKKRQTLEEKSIDELEIIQQEYILQDEFEKADVVKEIIAKKQIKQTQ